MTRYITGADNAGVRAVARARGIGLLVTPDTKFYTTRLPHYPFWAADNACFNHPDDFNTENYLAWLASFSDEDRARCLFAPAPDVVGDSVKTLVRSLPVLARIRALGFPAAFVAQDGVEHLETPWNDFDVLFIGGSTAWKLGTGARFMCDEMQRRGKAVHMGRVNSGRRFRLAEEWGCDTVDGTFLAFGPDINLRRLLSWLQPAREQLAMEW